MKEYHTECTENLACCTVEPWAHLVVEIVKKSEHAVLIIRIGLIDVLEQLDLIETLVKIVLVVLHAQHT